MFRSVRLHESISGQLFLHSMPGRYEALDEAIKELASKGITAVVSLAPQTEIRSKSSAYADAIEEGSLPVTVLIEPVVDYGVPKDLDAFTDLAKEIANQLSAGSNILVHCGAGIGRTGMFTAIVLSYLGMTHEESLQRVREASAGPETDSQRALVHQFFNADNGSA